MHPSCGQTGARRFAEWILPSIDKSFAPNSLDVPHARSGAGMTNVGGIVSGGARMDASKLD
jgi:hypothetical protein